MDVRAPFFSADGWQTILVTIDNLSPYLIIGLCILLFLNRIRLNRYENECDDQSDQTSDYNFSDDRPGERNHYGLANDPPEDELTAASKRKVDDTAKTERRSAGPRKKRRAFPRSFLRGFTDLCTVLGFIVGVMTLDWWQIPQSYLPEAYQPANPKARLETQLHEAKVTAANQQRFGGDVERALQINQEAMVLPSIPMTDNATPMSNVAELLIEQGKIDRAYWLAWISAELRSDDPNFVNPFAEVLIESCELDDAVDWLQGLRARQDERSRRLLERAEMKQSDCAQG